ncbi:DUF2637 domain-containing protein [Streptomyces albogriseolus]
MVSPGLGGTADHGLDGARAWAWPATVDLFIIAGELLVLLASLRGRIDGWAYALAAVGSIGSIALNVFGVGGCAQPMEYLVEAVLVGCTHRIRRTHAAGARSPGAPPLARAAARSRLRTRSRPGRRGRRPGCTKRTRPLLPAAAAFAFAFERVRTRSRSRIYRR